VLFFEGPEEFALDFNLTQEAVIASAFPFFEMGYRSFPDSDFVNRRYDLGKNLFGIFPFPRLS